MSDWLFLSATTAVGFIAGAIASVSGFGIGSLLTPLLAVRAGTAAMLGFDVPRQAFVATTTAVGVIVDGARMPVYLATQGQEIADLWPSLLAATVSAIFGTIVGERILRRIPEPIYRRLVAALVLALGVFMLVRTGASAWSV